MDKKSIFSNETLFARFMNCLGDILFTGILWMVFSIPILTMGASACAAYQCMIKVVRGKKSGVFRVFIDNFKQNLKITLPLKILGVIFVLLMGFDCIYLYGYGTDFSKTLSFILYLVIAIYIALVSYLYPLISRFDEKRWDLFKIAFFLTFRHFLTSVLLVLILGVCLYGFYLLPWTFFIMPGIYWYLVSFPIRRVLNQLSKEEVEEEEELEASSVKEEESKKATEIVTEKRRKIKKFWRRETEQIKGEKDDYNREYIDISEAERELYKVDDTAISENKDDARDKIIEKMLK